MFKINQLAYLAGAASIASMASLGTYLFYKQKKVKEEQQVYSEALDNVLIKSHMFKNKSKKHKNSSKKTHIDEEQQKIKIGNEDPAEEIKLILMEQRNKKNRAILENEFDENTDEELELKQSLDDFEKVINSKIKISSAQFNSLSQKVNGRRLRKDSSRNEFSDMISQELQNSAGNYNSVCLARVDEEAYICFTCMHNYKFENRKNDINVLTTSDEDDDEEGEEENYFQNKETDDYLNAQLDILGVQRGVSQMDIKKEPKKKKQKKSILPSLSQCEIYCWKCIQINHTSHLVCQISSKQPYINSNASHKNSNNQNNQVFQNNNFNEPKLNESVQICSSINSSILNSQFESITQVYSPKLNTEQYVYLTAMKEQMELQQMNGNAIGMYCSQLEQILVSEENIPVQIENHLSQELNLIFDVLFDRVKQAETEEFNNLLHIILKRIDEIMLDNNILIYTMGNILIKKNIFDRILRYDSLQSQNQKRLAEILMKMAKIDTTLRAEICTILLLDFKYVFVSYNICSALLFMLKSPEVRLFVTQKLNKTSQFCAGLLNIKSIFEKFDDCYRYRNKLLRCLYVTRALCEDRNFVVQGVLVKASKQFSELLCDIASFLETKSAILRQDFFKNIIHTNLAEEIFYIKNLDFNFKLLFHDFIQNAQYAPKQYRQNLYQKLNVYLKQNIENYQNVVRNGEMDQNDSPMNQSNDQLDINNKQQDINKNNDKIKNTKQSKNKQKQNNQTKFMYLNITSLNMLTIIQRDIRSDEQIYKVEEYRKEAQYIIKKYLFGIQEGYQILMLHHYTSVINNAQNRCLFEHLKTIYGFPEVGDFDLITLLQQNIKDGNFIKDVFVENNYPVFDLHQNLKILFTDYSNQLGQLVINIFQINHQELPFSVLLREVNKYVRLDNTKQLNLDIFCEIVNKDECCKKYKKNYQNEPIYRLKKLYYNEFFPLVFSKFPEDYDKLIKQQQLYTKLSQFDTHLTQQTCNQAQNGSSSSNEDIFIHAPKVLSANFFNSKENLNDIFGSDYDFILLKDRLITLHLSFLDLIIPTVRAFFFVEKENPILNTIIQIYLKIILFQSESSSGSQSTPFQGKNSYYSEQIPQNIVKKLQQFKSINKYLIEDIEFLQTHNFNPQAIKLKRNQSSK